jgi:hypothetical protein
VADNYLGVMQSPNASLQSRSAKPLPKTFRLRLLIRPHYFLYVRCCLLCLDPSFHHLHCSKSPKLYGTLASLVAMVSGTVYM